MRFIAFPTTATLFASLSSAGVIVLPQAVVPQAASAISLTSSIGTLDFSQTSGDFTITGGTTSGETFRLFQDVTGPNLDLFASITGLPSLSRYTVSSQDTLGQTVNYALSGFWLESVLTNRTDSAWTFFDHEVQSTYNVASPDGDGLSFAQGLSVVPQSDAFSTISQIEDVRDFVNFTGGTVDIGQTVTFRYFIADSTPDSTFYLRQRPNYSVASGGFIQPPPTTSAPTTSAPTTSAPTTSAPTTSAPAPTEPISEAIPEPGLVLGLLSLLTIAPKRRSLRDTSSHRR